MPKDKNGDWPKWKSCSSPVPIPEAERYEYHVFWDLHKEAARAWVKAEVNLKAWGERYQWVFAVSPTCAQFIMAKGQDYAKERLIAICNELIHDKVRLLWLREKNLMHDYHRVSKSVRERVDIARTLRSEYSLIYPPSVPAPSASATDHGSPASSLASVTQMGTRKVIED